jgi:beta-glucosidase
MDGIKNMIKDRSALVDSLLQQMSILEKIGQMTQADKNSIKPGDISKYFIGSILSGGGQYPPSNTTQGWADMVDGFQQETLRTRLAIPMIYGVDAIHGHAALYGATVFPQEIGLGATRDADLVKRIGQATAEELLATGIPWNFAPMIAATQDIRWGRTFECFSEDATLVTELGTAYLQGLQAIPEAFSCRDQREIFVLATPKHFLGDGGTTFGSSSQNTNLPYLLDRGDTKLDEARMRQLFLPAYQAAVENGARCIMVSYSSWNGTKMHAQKYWISHVLKGELGFKGFIVSDWGGIDEIDTDYYKAVVTAINAGIDLNMVPYDYLRFINTMTEAIKNRDISMKRVDDAVRRILTVKHELGLFNHPFSDPTLIQTVGSTDHRELARQAVRKSLVMLKNENNALPISKTDSSIYVAGQGADDIGMQCGGWTIEWMGKSGDIQPGTTIYKGIRGSVSPFTQVRYNSMGEFDGMAEVGIAVVGEQPYAEGVGDTTDLSLSSRDIQMITKLRAHCQKLVVLVLSGRPLVITSQYHLADAWVAVWLPGTEGSGVADVIFGDYPFSGKLPSTWPRSNNQLPLNVNNAAIGSSGSTPLFPFGFGLSTPG